MMKQSKTTFSIFYALFLIGFTTLGIGQENGVNQQRMERDLRIMEGVLNKLIQEDRSYSYMDGRVKALYLSGFGVVFHSSQECPVYPEFNIVMRKQVEKVGQMTQKLREEHEIIRQKLSSTGGEKEAPTAEAKLLESDPSEVSVVINDYNADMDKTIQKEEETIEEFKRNMTVFFQNYSSAIGQLKPDDRIVVLINLKNWQITDAENPFLIGWVLKEDIDRYRRNQMRLSDFRDRIHFQIPNAESDINRDIDIFIEILNRGMEPPIPFRGTSSHGVYIDGLGAVLYMDRTEEGLFYTIPNDAFSFIMKGKQGNPIIYSLDESETKEKKSEKTKSHKDVFEEIQDELFELLASYGHTLRLKPQESIILNVDVKNNLFFRTGSQDSSQFVLKLKKKDLDDYNKGIITIDHLRNRLVEQIF